MPGLLAQYLGLHLMQLRDDIRLLPAGDVERTAALGGLTRRDVLVSDHPGHRPACRSTSL
ncbi:hypothetical protein [Streptomyces sp. NPDC004267]|uniref:hypothetical protein n=1 Tax=Streptomyces sp. NPDC004267 TaxID=3364694 RepID=UPI0036AB3E69